MQVVGKAIKTYCAERFERMEKRERERERERERDGFETTHRVRSFLFSEAGKLREHCDRSLSARGVSAPSSVRLLPFCKLYSEIAEEDRPGEISFHEMTFNNIGVCDSGPNVINR